MASIKRLPGSIWLALLIAALDTSARGLDTKIADEPSSARSSGAPSQQLPVHRAPGPRKAVDASDFEQDVKYLNYEVRTHPRSFEIFKKGKLIYTESADVDGAFRVGCITKDDPGNKRIPMGRDITGSGQPEVVISEWTGGAHCCFRYHIFELGNRIEERATIDAHDNYICRFRDDPDGKLDFVVYDSTFAYWNASYAASPAPEVVLRYGPDGFQPATDLMRHPAPSQQDFEALVLEGRQTPPEKYGPFPNSRFWGIMLDLIYSGHADLAWKFCDSVWRGDAETKAKFLAEFRQRLARSIYWPSIERMNSGPVPAPTKLEQSQGQPSKN